MKLLIWLAIVAWLAVDLFVVGGPLQRLFDQGAARLSNQCIPGTDIRQHELSLALREALWRRGENWASLPPSTQDALRNEVLQNLLFERRIKDDDAVRASVQRAATVEEENFSRMLQFEAGRLQQCFQGQGIDAKEFRARAAEALAKQHQLELSSPVSATAAEAETWHQAHRNELLLPVRYHAAHLFLSGHEKDKPDRAAEMNGLLGQIRSNTATFEAIIAKYSDDERTKRAGGDLGWFTEARMPADFMTAVKALKPGQMSGVVRTSLGWHVIKLIEVKPAGPVPKAAVTDEIMAMLRNQRVQSPKS